MKGNVTVEKPNKPLDYEKLNSKSTEPILSGNLTREQRDVQGVISREMGLFVDSLSEKYKLGIDFRVMLIFPKDWGKEGLYGKN